MGEATHQEAPAQRSGWDRVPHAPGMKKALRVGLAATVAFFVGRFVFDDPQTAVFGALGSIALLVLADFGGAIAVRARAYVISIVIATGLVTLGTLVSKDTILAACALFVVALVVSLIAVIGRNAAGGAKAIILFFVVACAVPAPDAEIPARIAGVLVGGGLSIAAALLMWPDRAGRDFRALLGTAATSVGRLVGVVGSAGQDAGAPGASAEEVRVAAVEALDAATPERIAMAQRPAGPGSVDRAQLRLIHGLERVVRLAGRTLALEPAEGMLARAESELLAPLRTALDQAGAALAAEDPGVEPPATSDVAFAGRAYRERCDATLLLMLRDDPDPDAIARATARSVLVTELASSVSGVVSDTRIALRAGAPAPGVEPAGALGAADADATLPARIGMIARSALSPRSVVFQNALRLAAGLAVARAIAGVFGLENGFWVVFATLTVMRTTAPSTGATALQAIAGTFIGFAAVAPLLVGLGDDPLVYSLILPVVIVGGMYASAFSLLAGQAGFTFIVAVLFNLVTPLGWRIGLVRIEDVAIGAAAGVLIGFAIWPRGARGQLAGTVAKALRTGAEYHHRMLRWRLRPASPGDLDAAGDVARIDARRTHDAFSGFVAEGVGTHGQAVTWSELLTFVDMLWHGTGSLRAYVPAPPPPDAAALVEVMDGFADDIRTGILAAADALAAGQLPGQTTSRMVVHGLGRHSVDLVCHGPVDDPWALKGTIDLLRTRTLIAEMFVHVRRIELLVAELVKAGAGHGAEQVSEPAPEPVAMAKR